MNRDDQESRGQRRQNGPCLPETLSTRLASDCGLICCCRPARLVFGVDRNNSSLLSRLYNWMSTEIFQLITPPTGEYCDRLILRRNLFRATRCRSTSLQHGKRNDNSLMHEPTCCRYILQSLE